MEELQDRRRRADQAVKLQLRQPADGMEVQKIESDVRSECGIAAVSVQWRLFCEDKNTFENK